MLHARLLVLSLWLGAIAQAADAVPAAHAREFAGKKATVEGTLAEVRLTRAHDLFLNFERKYPGNDFAAVMFHRGPGAGLTIAAPWRKLRGSKLRVTGVVRLHQGRALITVTKRSQVTP